MAPDPDDVSMAEVAATGAELDALAGSAATPTPGEGLSPGTKLLLALQASILEAEFARDAQRRPVQAAAAALDALADGRGHDIPEVAALAALRSAIDRPSSVTPLALVRRHPRRRRIVATLALATVFSAGGVTAAAAASNPGDQLYSLRVAVLGRVDSDPVVSRSVLNEASTALAATGPGSSPGANATETVKSEKLLAQAASLVPKVHDPGARRQLVARLAALNATLHRQLATQPSPVALPPSGSPLPAAPSSSPSAGAGNQPGGQAANPPSATPAPHRRRHPVRPHPVPTLKPSRSPRATPRPRPTPTVAPTVAPTPSPTATPAPVRTRRSPAPSPSATGGREPTATPSADT